MSTDIANPDSPTELFDWWHDLGTLATRSTTLADWQVVKYRDAWCFTRRERRGHDWYMIRGTNVITFGWDEDSLETAYEMLTASSPTPRARTRVIRPRNPWSTSRPRVSDH